MRLLQHPGSGALAAVRGIEAEAGVEGADLRLRFRLLGATAALRLPCAAAPARADGLWQHTCFEAFIRGDGDAYVELNFAPSGAWAAYRFSARRTGMAPLELSRPPAAAWTLEEGMLALVAAVPVAVLPPGAALHVALAAVIEDGSGTMTYWALRHPPGRPDFHHPDGFVLELARH